MTRYLKPLMAALWLGLLTVPFAGVKTASEIAGAIFAGLLAVAAMKAFDASGRLAGVHAAALRGRARLDGLKSGPGRAVSLAVILALLVALPFAADRYALDLATQAGIYVMLALGLNIVVGQTGILVLGYVAFYAVGAYGYALLSTKAGIGFFPVIPIAVFLAGVSGLLLGAPILRLRGDYLAIVTLGFGEITRIVLNNWDTLTGGPNGISGIPRPSGFLSLKSYYFLVLLAVALTVFVAARLARSRIGRAWIAIREDETAAEAMGVNTTWLKLLAFALGAALAGLAGVFYAAKMGFVSPESFNFLESVIILCMVVLGGMGSIPGVILGAVVLYLLPEGLREFQQYRMLLFGAAMVVIMVFRPQGLIGTRRRGMEMGAKGNF